MSVRRLGLTHLAQPFEDGLEFVTVTVNVCRFGYGHVVNLWWRKANPSHPSFNSRKDSRCGLSTSASLSVVQDRE